MTEPDKKFVPVMERIQDKDAKENYNYLVRRLLPHDGEELLDCLVRTRDAIPEYILDIVTSAEEYNKGIERISILIGERGRIVPMVLPFGISRMIGNIKGWTYRGDDVPDVSDIHVATHAVVVGSALLLSDTLSEDDDTTVLDAMDHIRISGDKISMYMTKNSDYHGMSIDMEYAIEQVLNNTALGLRMYREMTTHPADNDIDIWMRYQDIGVIGIRDLMMIDCGVFSHDVLPIVRYYLELWKDIKENRIMPKLPVMEMVNFIDNFKEILQYQVHHSDELIKSIEQDIRDNADSSINKGMNKGFNLRDYN